MQEVNGTNSEVRVRDYILAKVYVVSQKPVRVYGSAKSSRQSVTKSSNRIRLRLVYPAKIDALQALSVPAKNGDH
jgi:hypothetical protein